MENVRWDLVQEWTMNYRTTMDWLEHDLPFLLRNRRTLKDTMDELWNEMNDFEKMLARRYTLGIPNRADLERRLEWLDEHLAREEAEEEEEEGEEEEEEDDEEE